MAQVGSWGSYLTFRVSRKKMVTFQSMQHSAGVEVQEHSTIVGKPKLQFVAPALEEVSFTMELDAMHCKKPATVMNQLLQAMQSGVYAPLVIGGRVILQRAIITKVDTDLKTIISRGKIYGIGINVTMKEYN